MSSPVISVEIPIELAAAPARADTFDRMRELAGADAFLVALQGAGTGGSPRTFADFRAKTNARYYAGTVVPPPTAPADGVDVLDAAVESVSGTAAKVYAWLDETPPKPGAATPPNWVGVAEVDLYGRPGSAPCLANPGYQNWWLGLTEDLLKSYPLAGLYFESERRGPFSAALGEVDATPACFCSYCRVRGARFGVDVERAREGYRALVDYAQAVAGSRQTGDENPFVVVWRILLQFPEVLHWERLWNRGRQQFLQELASSAELVSPGASFGWKLPADNSTSLLGRAELDLSELGRSVDFLALTIAGPGSSANDDLAGRQLPVAFNDVARPVLADFILSALGAESTRPGETEYDEAAFGREELDRLSSAIGADTAVYARVDSVEVLHSLRPAEPRGFVLAGDFVSAASDDELSSVARAPQLI